MTQVEQIFGWASFTNTQGFELLGSVPHREGPFGGGILIAPEVLAVTLADGVWSQVNERCGTLIDHAEEDELDPSVSAAVAFQVARLARERYGDGAITREVAVSEGRPVLAAVEGMRIRRTLEELATFLNEQAKEGQTVYVQF